MNFAFNGKQGSESKSESDYLSENSNKWNVTVDTSDIPFPPFDIDNA
jgi:hypothetical protein